jgi:hypothetical protein
MPATVAEFLGKILTLWTASAYLFIEIGSTGERKEKVLRVTVVSGERERERGQDLMSFIFSPSMS